jgi:NADPH:quinone reductase-like Zn-dependent oxidoreductase
VVDYTQENFTKNDQQYDLIFAANGYHTLPAYRRALTPQGRYVMAGGTQVQIFQSMLLSSIMSEKDGRTMGGFFAKPNQDDLKTIKEMFEAGQVKSVIDRRYPLREAAGAIGYLGEGHARGKIVITMENGHMN